MDGTSNEQTEILRNIWNQMKAQGDALRAEMAKQGDALRAEMAKQGDALRAEMTAVRVELREELGELDRKTDARFREVIEVLGAMNDRLGSVETHAISMDNRLGAMSERLGDIDEVRERLDRVERHVGLRG